MRRMQWIFESSILLRALYWLERKSNKAINGQRIIIINNGQVAAEIYTEYLANS